jgi:hypothetical protein
MNRSMKSVCKVVIILLAAGAVLFGAGLIFGARPADLWSKAELRFPCFVNSNGPAVSISADNGYEALDNDFSADGVYTVPAADVTALDLRWVAGSVTVRYGDVSEITFRSPPTAPSTKISLCATAQSPADFSAFSTAPPEPSPVCRKRIC